MIDQFSYCLTSPKNYQRFPALNDYYRFRTESMNLVRRSCGENSDHYRELNRIGETKETSARE